MLQKAKKKTECQLAIHNSMLVSKYVKELTIPFIPPHFIRSLTSPRTSQRAEKFTTAHFSILTGCTIFCNSI